MSRTDTCQFTFPVIQFLTAQEPLSGVTSVHVPHQAHSWSLADSPKGSAAPPTLTAVSPLSQDSSWGQFFPKLQSVTSPDAVAPALQQLSGGPL